MVRQPGFKLPFSGLLTKKPVHLGPRKVRRQATVAKDGVRRASTRS